MLIYSIYDKKAGCIIGPFFVRHEVDAVRRVAQTLRDPETSLAQYSEDYSLIKCGEISDATGRIDSGDGPEVVIPSITVLRDMLARKDEKNGNA